MFRRSVATYGEAMALGVRPVLENGEHGPDYVWRSYTQMGEEVDAISKVLDNLGVAVGDRVGIFAMNSPRWTESDLAIKIRGAVTVPLYSTLGPELVRYVLTHSGAQVVLCDAHYLPRLLGSAHLCPDLRAVVCLQEFDEDQVLAKAKEYYVPADMPEGTVVPAISESRMSLYTLASQPLKAVAPTQPEGEREGEREREIPEVDLHAFIPYGPEAVGVVHQEGAILVTSLDAVQEALVDAPVPEDADITNQQEASIFYTSGTTGVPKGVVLKHNAIIYTAYNFHGRLPITDALKKNVPSGQHIFLSYLPTAHVFSHTIETLMIMCGWRIGYFTGSTSRLVSDAACLRPTAMAMVPRVCAKIYGAVMNGIEDKGGITKVMFNMALKSKTKAMLKGKPGTAIAHGKHSFWDALVFKKTAALLGGRLSVIAAGAALVPPYLAQFCRAAFCCELFIGYGASETGCLSSGTLPWDSVYRSVGHIFEDVEARIVSYPPLGYDACPTDGSNPKGELQIRGDFVMNGYYKNPEATAEALIEGGWYRSSPIAEGTNIYSISLFYVFTHAEGTNACTVAIVVPDPSVLKVRVAEAGLPEADFETLCKDPAVTQLVLDEMTREGKAMSMWGYERPRAIHLESMEWSPDNLMTPTYKKQIKLFKAHYEMCLSGVRGLCIHPNTDREREREAVGSLGGPL
ncbi:hypothetical protein KIPB_004691 [Kipferlia bialata]|uniref:AMP-dependent synthetase/ligase domain-containing protein n=1 Tax=Kipferlia bialata TaxID=797122 RepID=A0A9K3CWC9_9EUKA|nr:hypothetical protein KIPB_004691 [Kipferlia bialata]|eukprot:g4691.t1